MRSQGAAVARTGGASRDVSHAYLERALRQRAEGRNVVVTVPAPIARPDALLRAFPTEASILWDPPKTTACAGLGVAVTMAPSASQLDDFFEATEHVTEWECPSPRVFGGTAFASGAAAEHPWDSFGDGFALLPRWTYHVDEQAFLSLAVRRDDALDVDDALETFDALWGSLERPIGVIPSSLSARRVDEVGREAWTKQVEDIRNEIRAGAFDKVVAARHCIVELETGARSLDVLKRLEERFPGCTRFAMWRGDAAFLGATPELLISRRGNEVLSEALAGSTPHGEAARMMESVKEREEHQLVVNAILKSLEPFCESLRSDDEPSVRELPNLLHMRTAIEGRLSNPTHVLSLVQALHPTPAVGGVPTTDAISWIVGHDTIQRGWYSAPIGWTDASGDGDFVVALRSGLLRDGKAWVYAGAGIMGDSDPQAEYAETELKMQALLGALHGDGR